MLHWHINQGCAVPTSLVPLSLMPYLSLVFLIRSEQLLINFFISYSWRKRIQVVQRIKGSFVCFRTNLYAVWHATQISCSYSKTVTTSLSILFENHQQRFKESSQLLKCEIKAEWWRLFYFIKAAIGLLNKLSLCPNPLTHHSRFSSTTI